MGSLWSFEDADRKSRFSCRDQGLYGSDHQKSIPSVTIVQAVVNQAPQVSSTKLIFRTAKWCETLRMFLTLSNRLMLMDHRKEPHHPFGSVSHESQGSLDDLDLDMPLAGTKIAVPGERRKTHPGPEMTCFKKTHDNGSRGVRIHYSKRSLSGL